MKTRAYWCARPFKDSSRFPYGFSRSGVFTLAESELLESKGSLLEALVNEQVFDPGSADLDFARAIKSGQFDLTAETRVWAKYVFHQRRLISICGGWSNMRTRVKTSSSEDWTSYSSPSDESAILPADAECYLPSSNNDDEDFLKAS